MTFVVLLIGVIIDRFVDQLDDWRSRPWFDVYIRLLHERLDGIALWNGTLGALVAVLLPVIAVWFVWWLLASIAGLFGVLFSLAVVVFALGPRELHRQLNRYLEAVQTDQKETAQGIAAQITGQQSTAEATTQHRNVNEAALIQANDRLFGIIFWFAVLGPVGAALYRVTCQFQEAALREYGSKQELFDAALRLHGILAWVPARLLAVAYALAGSFEDAVADWKTRGENSNARFFEHTNAILGNAGLAALRRMEAGDENIQLEIKLVINLISRALIIWLAVLALFTLAGLVV
ncbi:MAG TPA: regulatory signaling modulator protein AmpE [Gammaproteobacteria bacterium]|nr:regulatory signaling modulator protein AmpE [Gammaproteobacteria bacterium]